MAQYAIEKLLELGAKPVTLSDSNGHIYDEAGIDREKLAFVMELKNVRRGRIQEYVERYPDAVYVEMRPPPPRRIPCGTTRPTAPSPARPRTRSARADATRLVANGVRLVCEGANMPTTPDAVNRSWTPGSSSPRARPRTRAAWPSPAWR